MIVWALRQLTVHSPPYKTTLPSSPPPEGENNCGGQKGNSLANTGYACAMRQLVHGWRAAWSRTPGTTDPLAPFGVVTLASSGSEGGPNFGTMRIAQTASYGVLPSPELPNTFLAQAYDLDDTWGPAAGPCFAGRGNWACCAGKAYNATTCAGREELCAPACAANADTPQLMGGIHPRSKKPVGDRLGRAMYNTVYGGTGAFTGPTLSGCSSAGSTLTVQFNTSLLRGDTLALQPLQRAGGSQLWVQTNATLFCMVSRRSWWSAIGALSLAPMHLHPPCAPPLPTPAGAAVRRQRHHGRVRAGGPLQQALAHPHVLPQLGWRRRQHRRARGHV